MSKELSLTALPFPLHPTGTTWHAGESSLKARATPRSELFVDPQSDGNVDAAKFLGAARALGTPRPGDFQFSARVEADMRSMFDAGVLLLWLDDDHWTKLCFEYSPANEPMVVSVVNRGVCDDANAFVVDGSHVWLRISRVGRAFALHASRDGQQWEFVRVFSLGEVGQDAQIGFLVQSPTGDGCDVRFDDIRFISETLSDLRDGS